jgi:signal peptidase I
MAAPRRDLAAILAILLPAGVAHSYLGRVRRGGMWLAIVCGVPMLACLLIPPVGSVVGFGTTSAVLLAACLVAWAGPFVDVLVLPRERYGTTKWVAAGLFWPGGVIAAVLAAFFTRAFVMEAFKMPAASMSPTLAVGDHIFVSKGLWTKIPPARGNVIVFAFPEHPEQDFIKRVIAVPGDTLAIKNGHPVLNGWTVPSCRVGAWSYSDWESSVVPLHDGDLFVEFLGDQSYLTFYDRDAGTFTQQQGPYVVKAGEVWVLGDNRNNSHDSRMWFGGRGGGVPYANVRGRALFVWMSVGERGLDWSREGLAIHEPTLPASARSLKEQLDACLKQRPSQTLPPEAPHG